MHHVLLVEDSQEISKVLIDRAKRYPDQASPAFEFDLAEHITEAIDKLKSSGYDALLLDVILPADFEHLKAVRELEESRTQAQEQLDKLIDDGKDQESREVIGLQARVSEYDNQIDAIQDIAGALRVIEAASEQGRRQPPPVVFLTARRESPLRTEVQRLCLPGRYAWIEKPMPLGKVFDALRKLLPGV